MDFYVGFFQKYYLRIFDTVTVEVVTYSNYLFSFVSQLACLSHAAHLFCSIVDTVILLTVYCVWWSTFSFNNTSDCVHKWCMYTVI